MRYTVTDMPVKLDTNIKASSKILKEDVFVMDSLQAEAQDIRPLRVAILNLMPIKEVAEKQLLRLLANSPLQIEVTFLRTDTHIAKNADMEYLINSYKTFKEVVAQKLKFDALIVTGAPVEQMEFLQVDYWNELGGILDWAVKNVYSSMYICWAAQAALYYHYGIKKHAVDKKIFGVFSHQVKDKKHPLVRGFDDSFIAPHSRHTQVDEKLVTSHKDLDVLAVSKEAGLHLVASKDLRKVFAFGHGEYDQDSLHGEYVRDSGKGLKIDLPQNYYVDNKVGYLPPISWRSHQQLLFLNWLNYCVYQKTPYDIRQI